jgi:hypothetical protein
MSDRSAMLSGECSPWPTKAALVRHLKNAGLNVYEGKYSVRVEDFSHFVFQQYGGDIAEPMIDADAESVETLLYEAKLISAALAAAGVRHRFEVYDGDDLLAGYLHYQWPAEA